MEQTVTLYKCDACKKVLLNPEDGLVVHGNIYNADTKTHIPLLSDNVYDREIEPGPDGEYSRKVEDYVDSSVLCVPCFLAKCLPKHRLTALR